MKKLIFFVFLILFLSSFIKVGIAMSITPGRLEYAFESGREFYVDFYVESEGRKIEVYSKGDFSQYVTFDKTMFEGNQGFRATIRMPLEAEKPGINKLYIMAKQLPLETGGISTAVVVGALIKITVPYPGKYAEMSFSVDDANIKEDLIFNAEVSSLGKEGINANVLTDISVYQGKKIDSFELGNAFIKNQEKMNFQKIINSDKYGPGYYNATTTLDYGIQNKAVKIEKFFRIGKLFVGITNWTKEFYTGKPNRFDVEIESNWNNKIEHIYAEVSVYDSKNKNITLANFKTISESIEKWERKNLTGYLDTTNIEAGIYKTNITVFYGSNSTTMTAEIKVKKGINITLIVIFSLIIVLAVFIATILITKRIKRDGKILKNSKKISKQK